jgi:hypothetical protein
MKVKTYSIAARKSKVKLQDFARVFDGGSMASFIDSLPRILVADDLRAFAAEVAASRKKRKPVIVMMGAHVVKVGLAPLVIDLLEEGLVTALAMNSAAAIHDVETALFGRTGLSRTRQREARGQVSQPRS